MKTPSVKNLLRATLVAVLACALPALAGPDHVGLGTGKDKEPQWQETPLSINHYVRVKGALPADNKPRTLELEVGEAQKAEAGHFNTGDLVLVLQTTNGDAEPAKAVGPKPEVGNWEFARIQGKNGTTLTLTEPLKNAYAANSTQLIRVPEYGSLTVKAKNTLVPKPWNEKTGTGGVLAFLVSGTLTLESGASISATGMGFKVGDVEMNVSPTPNVGSGGQSQNYRGVGGANGRKGGSGNLNKVAENKNEVLIDDQLYRLFLGGGGGGTGSAAPKAADSEPAPGTGGGIIFIRAKNLSVPPGSGLIAAAGMAGYGRSDISTPMGSGGGAGGTLYLRITDSADCGTPAVVGSPKDPPALAHVNGGKGGDASGATGQGGGGAGGRFLFQAEKGSCRFDGTSAKGGGPGTDSSTESHGAKEGGNGLFVDLGKTLKEGFRPLSAPKVQLSVPGTRIRESKPTYKIDIESPPAGTDVDVFLDEDKVGTIENYASNTNFIVRQPTSLSPREHKVYAKAINKGQRVESLMGEPTKFTVDTEPPAVSVTSPAKDSRTRNTRPEYTGVVSDDSPYPWTVKLRVVKGTHEAVTAAVVPEETVTVPDGNTWSHVSTEHLPSGTYTVTATVTDEAGNTRLDSKTFTVDTAPTVSVTGPAPDERLLDTTPEFTGEVSDDSPRPWTVNLRVLKGAHADVTEEVVMKATVTVTDGNTWRYTPTEPLPLGTYTVMATVTDDLGSASDSKGFTEDVVRDFTGGGFGFGCAASGGDPSALAMMGLAVLSTLLARRRQR
jgi:uncharacterized protein (TIGR03382 family)